MMKKLEEIFQLIDKPQLFSLPNEKPHGNDSSKLATLLNLIRNNVNSDNVNSQDSDGNNLILKLISFTLQQKSLDQITSSLAHITINEDSTVNFFNSDTVMHIGEINSVINKDITSIFDYLIDHCNIDLTLENNKGVCFLQACYIFESFNLLSYIFSKKPQLFNQVFNHKEIHFNYAKNNYMLQFLIDKIFNLDLSDYRKYKSQFFQSMKNIDHFDWHNSNKNDFNNLAKKQKLYNLMSKSNEE